MRIAMIGQKGIFVTHDGGIETHVKELSMNLVKLGHEVVVYCRSHYSPEELIKEKEKGLWFCKEKIKLVFTPSINTKYLDTITHTFVSTMHSLCRDFDVIHYHGVGPSVLSFIPKILKRRAKTVVTFHSQDRYHKKWGPVASKFLEFGEWTACKFPHQTIAVSQTIQKYCLARFKEKINYIPNGVTIREVEGDNKIQKFGLQKDQYILSVARFIRHKGLHWLIEAYKNLKTDKKLVLVGESPYPSKYKDYLIELAENNENIIFTGYQSGETLDQLFQNAYIYVHPSESEGLSITILEAMSYAKCVLISDIPENLEAMSKYGLYFKTGDAYDLQKKLEELLLNPDFVKEVGARAREFVRKKHDWLGIARETLEVYKT